MLFLPNKNAANQTTILLEKDIILLEAELLLLQNTVNTFKIQLQTALSAQIGRIQVLTDICKNQKQAKKQKRLEQKKRGKNYKQPVGLKLNNASFTGKNLVSVDEQQLKRLYKEAIVQIHPDKIIGANEEINQRATDITARLNQFYKSGDLEELNHLYEHIISGNALHYKPDQPETINNLPAMIQYLQNKKQKLEVLVQEIKTSEIYQLWLNQKDLPALIEELKLQYTERIMVLEKRTR
ncbi:MAG: hypothetical protein EOP42_25080 [Sphingobacteriaceae bacterium]|nr:MAG: hypothetical protein EOP42_25080 [Sphingobacteriaceae bacterium]